MFSRSASAFKHVVGAVIAAALLLPAAKAQGADDVIAHMLANRISLAGASDALGVSTFDIAQELGYEGSWGAVDAQIESMLLFAECWSAFVLLQGSAQDIGLDRDAIEQFFELRMANDASFLPKCASDDARSQLSFWIEVWTVGDDFPVARHIEVTGNPVPAVERAPKNTVESAWLGYGDSSSVEDAVRDSLEGFVENFALTLLKVRNWR